MSIRFSCSRCGKTIAAADSVAGRKVKCPCGHVVTVPADETSVDVAVPVPRQSNTLAIILVLFLAGGAGMVVLCGGLMVYGVKEGAKRRADETISQSVAEKKHADRLMAMEEMSLAELVEEYRENAVRAKADNDGRLMKFRGIVDRIDGGALSPVVRVKSLDGKYTAACKCTAEMAMKVVKGQTVIVAGNIGNYIASTIYFRDCIIEVAAATAPPPGG